MALTASSAPTNTITANAVGQTLLGTTINDLLVSFGTPGASASTLLGGLGDDSYVVHSTKDVVTEKSGEGIDTVYADFIYALPAYVENLTLTGTLSIMGTGNAGSNIIKGNAANNVIDGAAGNDELTGGGGHDIFTVLGNDTIFDFGTDDYVNIQNFSSFTSFALVKSAMSQKGLDTVLKLTASDSVTFKNTTLSQFDTKNFMLKNQVSGYTQSFGDEFDSFSVNTGTGSTGNWYQLYPRSFLSAHSTVDHGSIQYFTFAGDIDAFGNPVTVDPFAIKDGTLSISMNPVAPEDQAKFAGFEYTSGMINSVGSFAQTYGYFEIRAKLPAGQGLHEAFWLLPVDGSWPPELDIMEQKGSDPTKVINVAHAIDGGQKISYSKQLTVPTATTEFHTYGLDWEPDYLTWYIDGVATLTMPTWPGMDKPMYMIANIGGGGTWSGDPNSTTPFPATMEIDYIRAFASANTVEKGVPVDKLGTDGADMLYGTSLNDSLNGGLGDDALYGGAGDDILTGGGGTHDLLDGGFGNDTYMVLSVADDVAEGDNKGIDTVKTTLSSYSLGLDVENLIYLGSGSYTFLGNQEDNYIQGGGTGGTMSGYGGNDTLGGGLGDDLMNGGDGNDNAHGGAGNDTLRGNNGNDLLFGELGNDLIKGDDGNDYLEGGDGNDNLQGGAGDDQLFGGAGADSLDGGTGNDLLVGGAGADTYFVDSLTETVVENAGEGLDTIKTRLGSFTLVSQVENLSYIGTDNFTGTGNELANKLLGSIGDDILDGAGGADILTGMAGSDVFAFSIGEADGDKILDFAGASEGDRLSFSGFGVDGTITQVGTSDFYVLQPGVAYGTVGETIQIVGVTSLSSTDYVFLPPVNHAPTDIVLTGFAIAESTAPDTIIGTLTSIDADVVELNSFTVLDDPAGKFKIVGNTVILAAALDFELAASQQLTVRLQDSAGHILDKTFTIAVTDINDTAPVITSAVSALVLENQVNVLDLTSNDKDTTGETVTYALLDDGGDSSLFVLDGSTLLFKAAPDFESASHAPAYNVTVVASDGANSTQQLVSIAVADVKAGDTLRGTGGNDLFQYAASLSYDHVDGLDGFDTLEMNAGNQTIIVGEQVGSLVLDLGPDGVVDFTASNVERLEATASAISFSGNVAASGVNEASLSGTIGSDTLDGSLSGIKLMLSGGAGADILLGSALADTLNGGAGNDQMTGGGGDDLYVVDASLDVVTELAGGGYDRVQTSLTSYTLAANVEAVTYTGTKAFTGKGNALDNVLTGSLGADRLEGLAGADIMQGGLGNDTYVVENAGDVVIELAGGGVDRILSQISYTLGDNVENLQLSTSKAMNGTGNGLANTLLGNAGINVLDGRGGVDVLTGGAGSDVFMFQRGEANGDKVTDFAGAGAIGGDVLKFLNFGADAYLTHVGSTDMYQIHSGLQFGAGVETIQLVGITNLSAGDYLFA